MLDRGKRLVEHTERGCRLAVPIVGFCQESEKEWRLVSYPTLGKNHSHFGDCLCAWPRFSRRPGQKELGLRTPLGHALLHGVCLQCCRLIISSAHVATNS